MLSALPIDPLISDILATVSACDQVILTATPGAGKTTRLPPELLHTVAGKIAVLQPRRMAAVAAAQHIAEERGWTLGKEVGYQVRFESKITPSTRLIFMTDALLLRQLTEDPELHNYDMIVIDEFHERNLNQDILLGALKELQELGRPIKIMLMSATLDVEQLQTFLPESRHIDVPGKVFPLEIRHTQQTQKLVTDRDFFERVSQHIVQLHAETSGDILVFLPGLGEIARTQEALEERRLPRDIFPLHGSLSLADQRKILSRHDRPRVILSTNIAEASVTVPGVDCVLDTGLAKVMEVHPKSGFSRLQLTRIAQFNARQRSGRAARQKAGISVRLWSVHDENTQPEEMAPECQRVDLTQTLLLLAHLGVSNFSEFAWLSPPPPVLMNMAQKSLQTIGAIDVQNILTDFGKRILQYPLPPRWAALLVAAENSDQFPQAAMISALMQEKDLLPRGKETPAIDENDLSYRLDVLENFGRSKGSSGISYSTAQNILQASEQFIKIHKFSSKNVILSGAKDPGLLELILLTQSDRLCRRRGSTSRGIMVGGRGVQLAKESSVKKSEFFVALQGIDLPGQPDSTISLACGLEKEFVLKVLKDQIHSAESIYFDEAKGQFYNRRVRMFKDLELDEPVLSPVAVEALGERFVEALFERWEWIVAQNAHLEQWMKRWRFLAANEPEMAEVLTQEIFEQTLRLAAFGKNKVAAVVQENLVQYLEGLLDKKWIQALHRECPVKFTAPSGHSHPIIYSDNESPSVEVRLQEMFGVTVTPRLGFGKHPLVFKLLAPNFRPVQVTADIASFWKTTYFEVRKELRTRYPKHSWPEDPLTAPAIAKGTRRR